MKSLFYWTNKFDKNKYRILNPEDKVISHNSNKRYVTIQHRITIIESKVDPKKAIFCYPQVVQLTYCYN